MDARRGRRPYPGLVTPAEQRVLDLVRQGLTNGEVADRLGLTLNTVKHHVANLLAKSGVASRDDLRHWRARGDASLKSLWPTISVGRWLGVGVGAASTFAAVVVVAAVAMSFSRSDELTTAPSPPAAVAVATPLPHIGPKLAPDRVPAVDSVALVTWDGQTPSVAVVDTRTGSMLASRETAYNPMATFRRDHKELLVSHMPSVGNAGRRHVLDVLDLENGLALKRRIPIPDRPNFKSYPPGAQAISNDERYFAGYAYTMRTELPECATGGDGPSCTRSRVRIIDLESPRPDEWVFELPRHCFGGIVPYGADAFIATCGDGYHVLNAGTAVAVDAAPQPRYLTDPVQARNLASSVYWLVGGDGWLGTLMAQGSFVWSKESEPEISRGATPGGRQLRWPIFAEVGDGRLVVGYIDRYYDQYPLGLAVYNVSMGVVEADLPAYGISRSMIAGGPDELIATTQDGRLIAVTVSTGAERTIAVLTGDPENVALVR